MTRDLSNGNISNNVEQFVQQYNIKILNNIEYSRELLKPDQKNITINGHFQRTSMSVECPLVSVSVR